MRLPGRLLSQLRIGVSASAVLVAGCDLAADPAPEAEASPAPAASAAVESHAPDASDLESTRFGAAASTPEGGGISGAVASAVERGRALDRRPAARPTAEEDPTAFVPFVAPGVDPPERVRPREASPLAFAEAPVRPRRPVTKPRPVAEPDEPCWDPAPTRVEPVKSGWDCPACGRG